jgi:pSer/pThr/pTyr-binding forkhead associated (FHA) protein
VKYYAEQYAHNKAYLIDVATASAGGFVTVAIGRSKTSTFRIPDESVSSAHAKLIFDRGRYEYFIQDEHSRNGTYLNGERLRPGVRTQLWSGAFVSFGNSVFVFLDPPTLRKLATLKG